MSDAEYDGGSRIQALLEYLHEREGDLETMAEQKRIQLDQCVQLRNFEIEARQVSMAGLGGVCVKRLSTVCQDPGALSLKICTTEFTSELCD